MGQRAERSHSLDIDGICKLSGLSLDCADLIHKAFGQKLGPRSW